MQSIHLDLSHLSPYRYHYFTPPTPCTFLHLILPRHRLILFSFPYLSWPHSEEEVMNLIVGGDIIACKNKALKSFVLFPRYARSPIT